MRRGPVIVLAITFCAHDLSAGVNEWTRVTPGGGNGEGEIAGRGLIAAPDEPDTVYALGGSGRFSYSLDRGGTWITPENEGLLGNQYDLNLAVIAAAPHAIYAGTAYGAFRTEDRGAHWTDIGPAASPSEVVLDPGDPGRIFVDRVVVCQSNFCLEEGDRSSDGGASWSLLGTQGDGNGLALLVTPGTPEWLFGAPAFPVRSPVARGGADGPLVPIPDAPILFFLVAHPLMPANLYGIGPRDNQIDLFRSSDSGETWILQSEIPDLGIARGLAIDPMDGRRLVVTGEFGRVLLSTDQGLTWTRWDDGLDDPLIRSVAFSSDGRTLYVGSDTAVYQYMFLDRFPEPAKTRHRPPIIIPPRRSAP